MVVHRCFRYKAGRYSVFRQLAFGNLGEGGEGLAYEKRDPKGPVEGLTVAQTV